MADVNPIPEGYPRVTPYLIVDDGAAAVDFYVEVFGAKERMRMAGPDGKIGHTEFEIGSGLVMLADEFPEMGALSPTSVGGSPVTIHLYVEDVDATFAKAIAAGATETQPVEDKFYGDRSGGFTDPWGHRWNIASHMEDVSADEMMRRAAEEMPG